MKTLTVKQPWAWAIIHGPKRIENRSWWTRYRGPLLIHAAKSRERLGDYGPGEPDPDSLGFQVIVGQVKLLDCVPFAEAVGRPFAEGPWCWLLGDPQLLPPIPWKGQQGLRDATPALMLALEQSRGRHIQSCP